MSRRILIGTVLAFFALFVLAASGGFHSHDGGLGSEANCVSCAAALLAVVAPPDVAAFPSAPEQPRPAAVITIAWPDRRAFVSLAARGPPAA